MAGLQLRAPAGKLQASPLPTLPVHGCASWRCRHHNCLAAGAARATAYRAHLPAVPCTLLRSLPVGPLPSSGRRRWGRRWRAC